MYVICCKYGTFAKLELLSPKDVCCRRNFRRTSFVGRNRCFLFFFCIDTHKQRQPRVDLQSIRGCCGQYNIIVDQRFTAKGRKQLMPGSKAGSIRGNRRHRCVASPPRPMKYTRNTPMVKKCSGHDRVTPLRQWCRRDKGAFMEKRRTVENHRKRRQQSQTIGRVGWA